MSVTYALINEEDGGFGISFPDFPGATSTGRCEQEVIRKGSEMLTFHVSGMMEDGDAIPVLRSLAEIKKDREFRSASKDSVLALISFDMPGKSVRLNCSEAELWIAGG